jgi:hypothetical protein
MEILAMVMMVQAKVRMSPTPYTILRVMVEDVSTDLWRVWW